tara:strand:- start:116 stop:433 length:318 start_codon:yes stop_codon:yes gene_type:complete
MDGLAGAVIGIVLSLVILLGIAMTDVEAGWVLLFAAPIAALVGAIAGGIIGIIVGALVGFKRASKKTNTKESETSRQVKREHKTPPSIILESLKNESTNKAKDGD